MSDLYRYDVGDESDPDSWGESPEAYMRRNWLEAHNYLVKVEPDTRLRAIADAWDKGAPKEYVGDIRKGDVRRRWPQLAALLDALEGTEFRVVDAPFGPDRKIRVPK